MPTIRIQGWLRGHQFLLTVGDNQMTGQSETKELSPILLLKSTGENLKWPILETSDNKTSLVCFTDKRKAEEFVEAQGMHGYELRTMELLEFGRWLRQNL